MLSMANTYEQHGVDPALIRRVDDEDGLIINGAQTVPVVKKRRNETGVRDKITLANMKARMSAYYKDGATYIEIADRVSDEFGLEGDERLSINNIEYHISALLKQARKQASSHINERMALALARLDQIEMLVTEAYFASMKTDTIHYERMVKNARTKDRAKQIKEDHEREVKRVERINKKRAAKHMKLKPLPVLDHVVGDLPELMVMTAENIKEFSRSESKPAGDPRFIAQLIDLASERAKLWGLYNRQETTNPDQDLARMPDAERSSRLAAVLHASKTRATTEPSGILASAGPLGGFNEQDKPTIKKVDPEELAAEDQESEQPDWGFD